MKNFNDFESPQFQARYGSLTEELRIKRHSTLNQMWIPIFFFRRFGYAAIIVLLTSSPLLQLVLCTSQSLFQIAWLALIRPFQHLSGNILQILNESTILFCFLSSFLFVDEQRSDGEAVRISWAMLGYIVIDMAINMVVIVYISVKDAIQKVKALWEKFKQRLNNLRKKEQAIPIPD